MLFIILAKGYNMRVLVVEDNALLRHHLAVQLREMGYQVDAAKNRYNTLI